MKGIFFLTIPKAVMTHRLQTSALAFSLGMTPESAPPVLYQISENLSFLPQNYFPDWIPRSLSEAATIFQHPEGTVVR